MEDMQKQTAVNASSLPVPRKVRGTLTIKDGDDMEFKAQRETGLSSQEEISHTRVSKMYRTVGEKKNKVVAHICIPNDVNDRRAFLYDEIDKLTSGEITKAKPKLKGRSLCSDEEVSVTANEGKKLVEVTLHINVGTYPDYVSRLLTLMQRVNKCFAINQTFLARLRS